MKSLKELRIKYDEKPITILLDNARYQHCKCCIKLAEEVNHRIKFFAVVLTEFKLDREILEMGKEKMLI